MLPITGVFSNTKIAVFILKLYAIKNREYYFIEKLLLLTKDLKTWAGKMAQNLKGVTSKSDNPLREMFLFCIECSEISIADFHWVLFLFRTPVQEMNRCTDPYGERTKPIPTNCLLIFIHSHVWLQTLMYTNKINIIKYF